MPVWGFKIHRYDPVSGQARITGPQHLQAETFDNAVRDVGLILKGLTAADPDRRYQVIELQSYDFRAESCEGGVYWFETAAELTERLNAKKESE